MWFNTLSANMSFPHGKPLVQPLQITTSKMNGSYDKSHREHGHGHRFGMSMSLVWSFGFDV